MRATRPIPATSRFEPCFDWSYELLSDDERLLLRRLAVFRGGWTLAAAEAVCAEPGLDPGDVLDLLGQLVAKSLVVLEGTGGDARYRFLDTVQAYSWERLYDSGEEDAQRRRHRDWLATLVDRAAPQFFRAQQREWLERMDREVDNVRAALDWTRGDGAYAPAAEGTGIDAGLGIASSLWRYWSIRRRPDEGWRWLADLLEVAPDVRSPTRASAAALAGYFACMRGDPLEAERLGHEAMNLAEELGDASAALWGLRTLGFALWLGGQASRAREAFEECRAREVEAGDLEYRSITLFFLGELARARGEQDGAIVLLEQSLALTREMGDGWGTSWVLAFMGHLALDRGELAAAAGHYSESLLSRRALGDVHGIHVCLEGLGWVAAAQGRAGRAAGLLGSAEALSETYGVAPMAPLSPHRERAEAAARARLGDRAFEAARADGRKLSLDQSVGFALSERRGRLPRPVRPGQLVAAEPFALLRPREQQVAALVAQGLSDRRIGETLVISRRTAEKHVANCLAKLGLASRAQLATWAIQAGLREGSGD